MLAKLIDNLGARALVDGDTEGYELQEIERELGIELSENYRQLLNKFKSSTVFDQGAVYKPSEKSPVDDSEGLQSLEMLYGLAGESNLIARNRMYRTQLPKPFVTIGESVGGNQICLSKEDGRIYFWHHEAMTDDTSSFLIADGLDEFILSLKPESATVSPKLEIDESKSFLNF
jgi:hypothetical protein